MNTTRYFIFVSCVGFCQFVVGFEFLTAALVGVSSVVVKNTYCKFTECCSDIPGNVTKLNELLEERLYGQHLVQDLVVNAIRAHWRSDVKSQKALTMSFHGWPGGGKNYVSNFIKESLYKKGGKSDFVHHFIGRIHFPLESKVDVYKENIYNWIKGNVTKCPKQLFIFDEVDKMPSSVLDVIKPIIDFNEHVEKIDYRQTIFIFLSNTGGAQITNRMLELWRKGRTREDLKLRDFESLIAYGAFNEEGGFYRSDNIKSSLIDHYIPFLPLEQKHIILCILDAFKLRGVEEPEPEHVEMALEHIEWGPIPEKVYSKTGCKRLSQKVAMIVQQNYT